MKSATYRLDRFISQKSIFSISETRLLIAQKRILIDGKAAHSIQQKIHRFSHVVLDGIALQSERPVYMMLHKPKGCISATHDSRHKTVLDLIDHPLKSQLHIAGRLDFNTTGLMLLTNDGAWSRRICQPESKLMKTYEVVLSKPLNQDYIDQFRQGIYFHYENITTQPAELTIVSERAARLSIVEGKYHQIKRMFGFFQNEVLELHRSAIGHLTLGDLEEGQNRFLTESEFSTY